MFMNEKQIREWNKKHTIDFGGLSFKLSHYNKPEKKLMKAFIRRRKSASSEKESKNITSSVRQSGKAKETSRGDGLVLPNEKLYKNSSTKSFKGIGKIYYLRKELVRKWENGLDKTWLNFKLKVNYVIGISGEYVYFIRVQNPRLVNFEQVPDFYKKSVNPTKKIYEYDAKLEKIERRVRIDKKRKRGVA